MVLNRLLRLGRFQLSCLDSLLLFGETFQTRKSMCLKILLPSKSIVGMRKGKRGSCMETVKIVYES